MDIALDTINHIARCSVLDSILTVEELAFRDNLCNEIGVLISSKNQSAKLDHQYAFSLKHADICTMASSGALGDFSKYKRYKYPDVVSKFVNGGWGNDPAAHVLFYAYNYQMGGEEYQPFRPLDPIAINDSIKKCRVSRYHQFEPAMEVTGKKVAVKRDHFKTVSVSDLLDSVISLTLMRHTVAEEEIDSVDETSRRVFFGIDTSNVRGRTTGLYIIVSSQLTYDIIDIGFRSVFLEDHLGAAAEQSQTAPLANDGDTMDTSTPDSRKSSRKRRRFDEGDEVMEEFSGRTEGMSYIDQIEQEQQQGQTRMIASEAMPAPDAVHQYISTFTHPVSMAAAGVSVEYSADDAMMD